MGRLKDKILYPVISIIIANLILLILGYLISSDWKSFYDLTPNWILWSFFGLILLWIIIVLIKRPTKKLNNKLKNEPPINLKHSNQIRDINGDNITVTQIISPEGKDLSKSLEVFINPLIESKQNTIDSLKESLNDKDEINSLTKENFELKI